MKKYRAILAAACVAALGIAHALAADYNQLVDPSPIASITIDGQRLRDVRVVGLTKTTVEVRAKDANDDSAWLHVPLADARKNWQLESRFRKALAAMERDAVVKDQKDQERKAQREVEERTRAAQTSAGIADISGKVLSVLPDGVLVIHETGKVSKLLTSQNLADGEPVKVTAQATDGVFQYTTAMGGHATVRVWRETAPAPIPH
jgi:hypothetical protein